MASPKSLPQRFFISMNVSSHTYVLSPPSPAPLSPALLATVSKTMLPTMETLHSPLKSLSVHSLAILPPFNRVNSLRSRPSLILCKLSLARNYHYVVTPTGDSHKIHNWIPHCLGHLFAAKAPSNSIAPLLSCSEGLAFAGHFWPPPFPQPPILLLSSIRFLSPPISAVLFFMPATLTSQPRSSRSSPPISAIVSCLSLCSLSLLPCVPPAHFTHSCQARFSEASSDHVTSTLYTFSKSPSGHTLSTHRSCLSYLIRRGSKVDHIPDTFPHNF